jgi:hypothetical protein
MVGIMDQKHFGRIKAYYTRLDTSVKALSNVGKHDGSQVDFDGGQDPQPATRSHIVRAMQMETEQREQLEQLVEEVARHPAVRRALYYYVGPP